MASNSFKVKNSVNIAPSASSGTEAGDIRIDSSDSNKPKFYNGSGEAEIPTTSSSSTLTNKTIDADSNTITNIENADIKSGAAIDAAKIADGSVSNTEFQHLDGVTSGIQTQINSKITAGAAAIVNADVNASAAIALSKLAALTADRAAVTNGSGALSAAATTATEIGYVNGVTSAIQTQLNAKASTALNNLASTAINANLIPASNGGINIGEVATQVGTTYTQALESYSPTAYVYLDDTDDKYVQMYVTEGTDIDGPITVDSAVEAQGAVGFLSYDGGDAILFSRDDGSGSGDVYVATGDSGANNSGNVILRPGTSAATRGKVKITDGSEGTAGHVLTSTGTGGEAGWAAPAATAVAYNYTAQSGTYSATINDWVFMSGASWTVTLPTAASQSGKSIVLQHAGSHLTQIYTINTTSSQTVGGFASGAAKLYTQGEVLHLVSDGSNWQIVGHKAVTDWVDGGANTVSATTTPPTKGSATFAVDRIWWRRDGKVAEFRLEMRITALGTGTAGTGDYLFTLPSNMTLDSGTFTLYTTAEGSGAFVHNGGVGSCMFGTGEFKSGQVIPYDSTQYRLVGIGNVNVGFVGGVFDPFATGVFYSANFTLPITGWLP